MKFHTQLKAKDIFKFSLAYTYSGVQAILTIFMLGLRKKYLMLNLRLSARRF